jgi:hypothetical protein
LAGFVGHAVLFGEIAFFAAVGVQAAVAAEVRASLWLARLLRVVERLSLAAQETPAHVSEKAQGDHPDLRSHRLPATPPATVSLRVVEVSNLPS